MQFRVNDFEIVEHAAVVDRLCSHCGNEASHVLMSQPHGIGVGLPFMKPKWSSHRLYVLSCSICSHYDGRVSKDIAEALIRKGKEELAEQEQMENELERCRQATINDPKNSEVFLDLGRLLYKLDRWEESVPAFERAVELDPNNSTALAMLGLAYSNLNRGTEGVLAYEKAYQLDPSHPGVTFGYGEMLARTGDAERAMEIYTELRTLDEHYSEKLLSLMEEIRNKS